MSQDDGKWSILKKDGPQQKGPSDNTSDDIRSEEDQLKIANQEASNPDEESFKENDSSENGIRIFWYRGLNRTI